LHEQPREDGKACTTCCRTVRGRSDPGAIRRPRHRPAAASRATATEAVPMAGRRERSRPRYSTAGAQPIPRPVASAAVGLTDDETARTVDLVQWHCAALAARQLGHATGILIML